MKKGTLVYVVIAYRWGDTEKHSYPVSVQKSQELARVAAKEEVEYRGGKYSCYVFEMAFGQKFDLSSSKNEPLFPKMAPIHIEWGTKLEKFG